MSRLREIHSSDVMTFYGIDYTDNAAVPFFETLIPAGYPNPADDYLELKLDLNKQLISNPRLLYRRQQGKCPVCQTKITTDTGWHTHHVQEKYLGGKWTADNLVLLHPNCHRQVHN